MVERSSAVQRGRFRLLFSLVGLFWGLELLDTLFLGQSLNQFGIRPRLLPGLRGVLLAPLLHGGLGHLLANTVPFALLGALVAATGRRTFVWVTGFSWLVGGLGVWLLGGERTLHIGSSILVFGYLGYLLARAFYERSLLSLSVALIVGVTYGGALWGVLPLQAGVSWQGHLFGFVGGVLAARAGSKTPEW